MPARAIFKAVVRAGEERVPVKLYSAVEDRSVHFRLLHEKDHAPVRQAMVNPETDEVVPNEDLRRAFETDEGALVRLEPEELDRLGPEPSRELRLVALLAPDLLDHRWYDRPYYLGPDGDETRWASLAAALARSGREALARWTMRGKAYQGLLRARDGHLVLITVRHEGELIPADALQAPTGKPLDSKELDMARQLIGMLEGPFEHAAYHDAYRERVMQAIDAKRAGGTVEAHEVERSRRPADLTRALRASLEQAGGRA